MCIVVSMVDVVIKNVTGVEAAQIAQMLARADRDHEIIHVAWTAEEADIVLGELAPRQYQLITMLVAWDGVLPVDAIRDGELSLRGITGPITKTVKRLADRGLIREGLPKLVSSVYDPEVRAYQRVRAFRMDSATLIAFGMSIDAAKGKPAPGTEPLSED